MKERDPVDLLSKAHYHLMDNPRFWYEKGLMDASRILCVAASDLRVELCKGGSKGGSVPDEPTMPQSVS